MKTYEYKFLTGRLDSAGMQSTIAALGAKGWMLVAATPRIEPTRDWMIDQTETIALMREIQTHNENETA